jgi:hypothetical protein
VIFSKEKIEHNIVLQIICEGNLFCFVSIDEIHQTKMLQIVFLVSLESSQGGGVHRLGFMAFGLVV